MQNGIEAAGYGPPGGGGYGGPPGGGGPPPGGGYGGPPGGGYGGPPGGPPPGGGYGGPPGAPPPGGGGFGPPPGGGYGAPPPGGYGGGPPPYGGFGPGGPGFAGGPMMPGAGGDVNTTVPLVLSILMIFPCGCSGGILLGIPALIFAIQAGNAKKAGDYETARGKAKVSYILVGVGFGLSVLFSIIGQLNR